MQESFIRELMVSIKCSVCGQHYRADSIEVLGNEEDLWFLSVFCMACDTRYLVAAIIREDTAPAVITDLTEAELDRLDRLRDMDKIRPDDVLDMHNFLKDFDGDFSRLFSQK